MTPAQVAHIMALVTDYAAAVRGQLNFEQVEAAYAKYKAVEAALRDAPQAEPTAWHVNFRGSSHLLTSLESVDLTGCIVTPLYPEPRAPDNTLKDRLLAALERAAGAESALRRLADKTEPLTQTRGYHALVQVIYELQQDGNYSDEEGEETSALVELLRAIEATPSAPTAVEPQCRDDGRCQYAIDHGAEGLGHCPKGKCVMPDGAPTAVEPTAEKASVVAPDERAGHVLVPVELLERAAESLGSFVSDHGWSDWDMQNMDNLDTILARHNVNLAARASKGTK